MSTGSILFQNSVSLIYFIYFFIYFVQSEVQVTCFLSILMYEINPYFHMNLKRFYLAGVVVQEKYNPL